MKNKKVNVSKGLDVLSSLSIFIRWTLKSPVKNFFFYFLLIVFPSMVLSSLR